MPSKKTSELTAASALTGTEMHHVVQGGADRRASAAQVRDFIVATAPVTIQVISGNSGGASIPAGATRYISHALVGGHWSSVYTVAGRRGRFRELRVTTQGAPGAGESWTFTLQKLFADTAITCTISGTGNNSAADVTNVVEFAAADRWCIKVVSSANAAATNSVLFTLIYELLE